MNKAAHLQSDSEDRSTKLQMTAGVEIYVRVFRLPLFCLIFTGIASGLDKKGAYFFWYFIFIHHQIVQCVLLCSRNKSDVRLLQDAFTCEWWSLFSFSFKLIGQSCTNCHNLFLSHFTFRVAIWPIKSSIPRHFFQWAGILVASVENVGTVNDMTDTAVGPFDANPDACQTGLIEIVLQVRIVQDIPSTWKSSSSHYDVNQVYGLSLPRTVESTQWSHKANLVGVPVDQVKVVDVIPGGMSNWGLRLIGNGRYTAFELFRSRLEAMIVSTLTKSFCKLQSEIDIQKLVAHFNSSLEGKTESPSRRKWWRVRLILVGRT